MSNFSHSSSSYGSFNSIIERYAKYGPYPYSRIRIGPIFRNRNKGRIFQSSLNRASRKIQDRSRQLRGMKPAASSSSSSSSSNNFCPSRKLGWWRCWWVVCLCVAATRLAISSYRSPSPPTRLPSSKIPVSRGSRRRGKSHSSVSRGINRISNLSL